MSPSFQKLGTFSTDGFQDGYGELDRAGLGIQGAVRAKARENKNSLATKTIPDYGVNKIVGETRHKTRYLGENVPKEDSRTFALCIR